MDNCPTVANPDASSIVWRSTHLILFFLLFNCRIQQANFDGDAQGDVCDPDDDNDDIPDTIDPCPFAPAFGSEHFDRLERGVGGFMSSIVCTIFILCFFCVNLFLLLARLKMFY